MNYKKIFGELPRNWTVGTLDQYAEVIDPHPSHRAPSEVSDGYPFLGIGDLDYYGNATFDKARHVGLEIIEEHEHNYKITETSIGYAKMGNTIGKVVSFPSRQGKTRFAVSPALSVINPNDQINPYHLRAVVESNAFWGQVNGKITGSTRPSIGIQQLRKILIPLPPEAIQERIGEIWKAIYDKISVNTNINDNLQQQAQALFEQRFIVEDIEGEEKPLYDFADYINGAAFKPSECGDQGLPIIKIAELKNGITDSTKYFDGFKGEKYLVHDKDILFSWSGNPDTSIDIFIWTHGKAILNQHTFNVKSNTGHRWFTFLMLKYFRPEFSRIASNKQTTGLGHVTASDLKRLTFISNEAAIEVFEHEVSPFMETIYSNMMENQRLAQLRDSLLPKLMSGEIDVSGIQT